MKICSIVEAAFQSNFYNLQHQRQVSCLLKQGQATDADLEALSDLLDALMDYTVVLEPPGKPEL